MGVLDGDCTGIEVDAHLDCFSARLAEIVLQQVGAVKSRLLSLSRLQCQPTSNDQQRGRQDPRRFHRGHPFPHWPRPVLDASAAI